MISMFQNNQSQAPWECVRVKILLLQIFYLPENLINFKLNVLEPHVRVRVLILG